MQFHFCQPTFLNTYFDFIHDLGWVALKSFGEGVELLDLSFKRHSEILKFNFLKRILFIFKVTVNLDLFKCSQIFYPGFELGFSLVPSYKHLGFFSFQSHLKEELKKVKCCFKQKKSTWSGSSRLIHNTRIRSIRPVSSVI